jgi:hypothetical protein
MFEMCNLLLMLEFPTDPVIHSCGKRLYSYFKPLYLHLSAPVDIRGCTAFELLALAYPLPALSSQVAGMACFPPICGLYGCWDLTDAARGLAST